MSTRSQQFLLQCFTRYRREPVHTEHCTQVDGPLHTECRKPNFKKVLLLCLSLFYIKVELEKENHHVLLEVESFPDHSFHLRRTYTKHQHPHRDNTAMTLVIQLSLKPMESLENVFLTLFLDDKRNAQANIWSLLPFDMNKTLKFWEALWCIPF